MGQTAENVAEKYGVTRADQDAFAVARSRRRRGARGADGSSARSRR